MKNQLFSFMLSAFLFSCYNNKDTKETINYSEWDSLTESSASIDSIKAKRNVIGRWEVKPIYLERKDGWVIEIFEEEGFYYAENKFYDGSYGMEGLIREGNKFIEKDNQHGDYYVLKGDDLRFYGEDGDFTDECYVITRIK